VAPLAKIRVVTDSTADIPQSVRERLGIEMVPLKVHFGNEVFLDAVTIQSAEFYKKLMQSEALPTTSQPSPADFLEVYKKVLGEDPETEIISVHLSAALSGTYQSAVMAQSMLDNPERVTVVDSKSASYGFGMYAVEAAKAAREGKSKEECLELIQKLQRETKLYFLVGTLEYLQKGGRIGKASALVGSLLNIKPILTIDADGEVASVEKVRGQKKAMKRIVELLAEDFAGTEVNICIAHADCLELGQELGALVQEHFQVKETEYTSVGPVIGTHAGPGTVAVFMRPA
jgi:DegV family protein with EDD domain